jgi:hypothetical protein
VGKGFKKAGATDNTEAQREKLIEERRELKAR